MWQQAENKCRSYHCGLLSRFHQNSGHWRQYSCRAMSASWSDNSTSLVRLRWWQSSSCFQHKMVYPSTKDPQRAAEVSRTTSVSSCVSSCCCDLGLYILLLIAEVLKSSETDRNPTAIMCTGKNYSKTKAQRCRPRWDRYPFTSRFALQILL